MRFTYGKKDKLKSKKTITHLFSEGKAVTVFPLRLVYVPTHFSDGSSLKTGVSVSKRLHKKAVVRNHIKRLLRESFRLHRHEYFNKRETAYAFMILYISKDVLSFQDIDHKMKQLLKKFEKHSLQNETISK